MTPKEFAVLTLTEISSISGIDKARWSKYFSGKVGVTDRTLSKVAPRFNMSPEELYTAMCEKRKNYLSKKTT